jgi:protocatechuate 3,4-dioxygenase beta subunit
MNCLTTRQLNKLWLFIVLINILASCQGQPKPGSNSNKKSASSAKQVVGNGCEGCELMYVGMPKEISSESTSAGWAEGEHKLIITGKVFQLDGKTPAPNVIVYYWHTDEKGIYAKGSSTPAEQTEHGRLRGWIKSDENGNYKIKTSRPAAYPTQDIPQHIHLSIKEPAISIEYYADLYFDDDPLYLKHKKKYGKADRAGTELLRVVNDGKTQIAEHNVVLGLNIPNYPTNNIPAVQSGLNIGEDQPSFIPYHAFGPDKGTRTCPVCKYGRYHGVVYFVGNNPNWGEMKNWLKYLDDESISREKYLKAYFVYGNSNDYNKQQRETELEKIGTELGLKKIALTFVPSFTDTESEANLNKINAEVENTFIVYRHRTIVDKFINLKPTEENFKKISAALDRTKSVYFDLPEPKHE